jgi:hypothetical protein
MHFCMANNFDWLIDYITSTPGLAKYEKAIGPPTRAGITIVR